MRKLLSTLALLLAAIGVHAQSWTPVPSTKYNHETIVYADLNHNIQNASLPDFKVAAFVDDECRAEGELTMANDQNDWFFLFNVRGDLTADAGKQVTFKVYYSGSGAEYDVKADPVVMFDGESHITPSNRIQLTLTAATSITMNDFSLNVGETVNLLEQLNIEPAGAQLPDNIIWNAYNSSVSLEGNTLTGVSVGGSWIDLYIGEIKDDNYITGAECKVLLPATGIEIVTSTFTVDAGNTGELTAFMTNGSNHGNAYRLQPAAATEEVKWELKNDGVIVSQVNQQSTSMTWTPVKGGITQIRPYLERDGGNIYPANNQWITVTVMVPVTEIRIAAQELTTSTAMQSTASRIVQNITVWPEDATDKTYKVTSSDPSVLQITYDNTGDFTARGLKSGNVTLTVTANDGSGVSNSFKIYVEDPAHTAWFDSDPLVVTLNTTDQPTDITQQITRNIHTDGDLMWANGSITTVAGGPVSGSGMITGNGSFGNFTAQSEGTSTINVTLSYNDWDAYSGTGDVPQRRETFTFQVQVVMDIQLQGFTLVYTHNANGKGGVLTATPVPANATFNASDIEIQVYNPDLSDCVDWQNATLTLTSSANNVLNYDVQAPAPGEYTVNMPAYPDDGITFAVPDALSFTAGWQWRSNPWGKINGSNNADQTFQEVFQGDKFYEARTQDDLLINDPEWGYFGTLLNVGIDQAKCYKLKMTSATTNPSFLYYGTPTAVTVYLNIGWTWVGSPYFYDRSLANIFDTSVSRHFPEGLVIISKDNGSAEWNGSAWEGDLTVLKHHEGYLVYAPQTPEPVEFSFASEYWSMLPQDDDASAPVKGQQHEERIWQYDASQFMNNMTMVAELPQVINAEDYSIGAFVGDECRGEGVVLNGKAFVTIHTDGDETVSLKLYNKQLGRYFDIEETFRTQTRLGSLKAPVQLHAALPTGLTKAEAGRSSVAERYDLSGRRISNDRRGVNIQRMTDGTVRKVVVK